MKCFQCDKAEPEVHMYSYILVHGNPQCYHENKKQEYKNYKDTLDYVRVI